MQYQNVLVAVVVD